MPKRGGRHWSLSKWINQRLSDEEEDTASTTMRSHATKKRITDPLQSLASRVSAKLEEGNFRGAVRLACSEDSIAEANDTNLAALQSKHPAPHPDSNMPSPPNSNEVDEALSVEEGDLVKAIRSFPKGSAGGPDGLRPQHLVDLTSPSAGHEGELLLHALTAFTNLVLAGDTLAQARGVFFGASLTALNKKDGGVRPIAVGCTLRRLVAKTASQAVMKRMGSMLAPHQLGYGTPLGAEAAVHAARQFVANLPQGQVLLKLDFKNAFNSVRRDKVLESARQNIPEIFPFVYSCYSAPSTLSFADSSLSSAEGVQQGDPLGPLLFCLVIHPLILQLKAEFRVFYLDDGTLGGAEADVLYDFQLIDREARTLGLQLNQRKSELICDDSAGKDLLAVANDLCKVSPANATLLGSPIGSQDSIDSSIEEKLESLKVMRSRFSLLSKHDALCLLRYSFAIPKILYILRTAPCFTSPHLEAYDSELRSTLSEVLNIDLEDDSSWLQASLPVGYGGVGIRRATQLAPSAFLASAAGSSVLTDRILPDRFRGTSYPEVDQALSEWSKGHDQPPPPSPEDKRQKAWDAPRVQESYDTLLDNAPDARSRARLLAVATRESGAWLHALPISAIGLRMDDDVIRTATGLRLGAPICRPHYCQHCHVEVDKLGTHGLSCVKSAGRHSRHAAINSIVQRSLAAAKIPSTLEPSGLFRSDGKRPDGITIAPWRFGRSLVWDVTCPDTYASSYVQQSTSEAGAVANLAEARKKTKYVAISRTHHFIPIAIETSGALGHEAMGLITDIARRIRNISHEPMARAYLLQRISVAIQQGNAAAVLGTTTADCFNNLT